MNKIEPIIKWVGGKRQILDKIKQRLPQNFNDYYEPFVGGGAIFFGLSDILINKKVLINDINSHLINLYKVIKNDCQNFIKQLEEYDNQHNNSGNQKLFYLNMRDIYNDMILNPNKYFDYQIAAMLVYINKHCFNGLYRVNSKGLFNVPFNNKKCGKSFIKENIDNVCNYLNSISKNKKLIIDNKDFEKCLKNVKENDFVFFDSPYAPLKKDSFESYTKDGFDYQDHLRLAKLFDKLSKLNVKCMLTNHNTELINNLYKDYYIEVVEVKRMINSDATKRYGQEVIITNYPTKFKNFITKEK